ncbi:HopJ type III effector protein [Agitococcus lubricus]|uniref:HopJ type III effector protein n=1 Tax=Agitococcus lubricus TaxID=1077255 RepID=A0A2T5J3P7_9GAMM|nr:HopJ type III effector protein [Agitococcus lubricus]PTQ91221.1 HopJ type III effector protein [Agitococcus lubricus]
MLAAFLEKLSHQTIDFEDTIEFINQHYDYTPSRFTNGINPVVVNQAGQNEGSCRIFAFALLNTLTPQQTLACFGRFYQEVLNDPQGTSHANIRAFMRDGWTGIQFDSPALHPKK